MGRRFFSSLLAVESHSFANKMRAIQERLGYRVIADVRTEVRGQFDLVKQTFTYNPATMTRLDLAHEMRHYRQIRQLQARGLKGHQKMMALSEQGAYGYERKLWMRAGISPSKEYVLRWSAEKDSIDISSYDSREFIARAKEGRPYRGIKF